MSVWKKLISTREVEPLVEDFIESYMEDRDTTTYCLMDLIVCACACTYKVEDQDSILDIITTMENEIKVQPKEFPLKRNKKIFKNFYAFMAILVQKCADSILYDRNLFRKLIVFLFELSRSKIRGFRYTSVIAGLSLCTELAKIYSSVTKQLSNIEEQLSGSSFESGESERLEILQESQTVLRENKQELSKFLKLFVKQMIEERVKDIASEIRIPCCEGFCALLVKFPEFFMREKCVNIVGEFLYDNSSDIRLESLKCLQSLILFSSARPVVESSISKHINRLTFMVYDTDETVAYEAFKLTELIRKFFPSLVKVGEETEKLLMKVYSRNHKIAQLGGKFVLECVRAQIEEDNNSFMQNFLDFFLESNMPEHASALVDAVWDLCDEVKDWEAQADFLLNLTNSWEKIGMAKIIMSCIKRAVTGKSPRNIGSKQKKSLDAELEQNRENLTRVFIKRLPQIIQKNCEEHDVLLRILNIPQYLEPEIMEENLYILLDVLKDVSSKTASEQVMESCANFIIYYLTPYMPTSSSTQVWLNILLQATEDEWMDILVYLQENIQENPDNNTAAVRILNRFHLLCKCDMPFVEKPLWTQLFNLLSGIRNVDFQLSHEIQCSLILTSSSLLKQKIMKQLITDNDIMENNVREYLEIIKYILTKNSEVLSMLQAYIVFCDISNLCFKTISVSGEFEQYLQSVDENVEESLKKILTLFAFCSGQSVSMSLLERKRIIIRYYNLISCAAVPQRNASIFLLQNCGMWPEYEQVSNQIVNKLLESSEYMYADVVVTTLFRLFLDLLAEESNVVFDDLKHLAKKFSAVLQQDVSAHSVAVTVVHKTAIDLVANERDKVAHFPFFGILQAFTDLTRRADIDGIIYYAEGVIGHIDTHREDIASEDGWKFYQNYIESLERQKRTGKRLLNR